MVPVRQVVGRDAIRVVKRDGQRHPRQREPDGASHHVRQA